MKLKKPDLDLNASTTETKGNTTQFIKAGDKRPITSNKLIPSTFRLPESAIGILDTEAERAGQNKTAILKAALLAYSNLDENSKNLFLLESFKL
ncbi:ribbon-helix-helix protein, CopG family [Xenorhabdus bovienii]|uniref:ribbon-helix-helix protein, CopG family n=1 Tax=Xenorhabdus bovienii TaxID=40576 RepID=UPI0023B32CC3|nr:ribbon-helix-helix protein, CopG family [Xenorhabdus bovienii]MDE9544172.1 ribbon-helix-helix domain-containing protein [Xenorhabdus bovienii]